MQQALHGSCLLLNKKKRERKSGNKHRRKALLEALFSHQVVPLAARCLAG